MAPAAWSGGTGIVLITHALQIGEHVLGFRPVRRAQFADFAHNRVDGRFHQQADSTRLLPLGPIELRALGNAEFTRQGRDESYYRVVTSKLFYAAMRWLTFPNMPPGGFDFVLLGRRAVTVLLENRDSHLFLQGQILWMGFTTKFIAYERRKRQIGTSRWTFGRKLTYLIDGILSYSYFPIRFISCTGIVFALIGFIYAAVVVLNKVLLGNAVKGWTPLMVVVLVIGGLQMMMLGVIGEYLWRTLSQVRKRSDYIIDAVYEDAGENA